MPAILRMVTILLGLKHMHRTTVCWNTSKVNDKVRRIGKYNHDISLGSRSLEMDVDVTHSSLTRQI